MEASRDSTGSITVLLTRMRSGDAKAMDSLFEKTYDELHKIAQSHVSRLPRACDLQATALVNAACEQLLGKNQLDVENRRHFFFVLSRAMHDVLVKYARAGTALKRGGGAQPSAMVEVVADGDATIVPVLELHAALDELRAVDRDAAQLISLCYFGGRSLREAAELMGCTFSVARGHLDYAKAWLRRRLS